MSLKKVSKSMSKYLFRKSGHLFKVSTFFKFTLEYIRSIPIKP